MDVSRSLDVPCPATALFPWVEDLGRYPAWLGIVAAAEPAPPDEGGSAVWTVDLQGRVGPVSRTKRVRMVRSAHVPPERASFERRELDGRDHARWLLDVDVVPAGGASRLTVRVRYDGSGILAPVLQRALLSEVDRAERRLVDVVRS